MTSKTRGRWAGIAILLAGVISANAGSYETPSVARAAELYGVDRPTAEEVLPEALWPGTGDSISALRAALQTDEAVERLAESVA